MPGSSTSSRSRSTSGWKVVCACSSFASRASSANGRRSPVSSRVQRGQRRLAGRVDEQAGGVGHELVADRPLDRPVGQLLAGLEDLLHPDVLDAALAQPRAGSRAGSARPSGWSMRRPSTTPSATRPSTSACVTSKTSGSSTRTPASSSMSKKRRWRPVLRVDVEEALARSAGSAQKGFSSSRPCGWGRCRAARPGPRAGERAERRLAAEVLRDRAAGRRRRSRASSRAAPAGGRQVEVADAEVRAGRGRARARRRSRGPGPSWRR